MEHVEASVIRQHLIDPEICIRCNTCEATCPVGAITHDARNYVVDAEKCNLCMACVPPCPTGSIDNWRVMPRALAYGARCAVELGRIARRTQRRGSRRRGRRGRRPAGGAGAAGSRLGADGERAFHVADYAAVIPPWSAAHPYVNLYGPRAAETDDWRRRSRATSA